MRIFGYDNGKLPKADIALLIGEPCAHCGKHIQLGDVGVAMPHMDWDEVYERPWHLACLHEALGITPSQGPYR